MGIDVDWFVTDDGIVVEQVLATDPLPLEELLILPMAKDCNTIKISEINHCATDFLVPYYQGNILLAENCLDIYLDILAEIGGIEPYWFLGLESRFFSFDS